MPRESLRQLLLCLLPALLFVGLHARSLDYPFVWTDDGEIVSGGMVLPPGEIASALFRPMLDNVQVDGQQPYYRPVHVATVSLIDHHLGRQPRNFRAVSIVLGALTCALFACFAVWLLGSFELGLLAGTVAAAHPVLVQNHVWIAGLGQAIATPFLIANLWTGCLAMRRLAEGRDKSGYALTLVSLVCLAIAMLAKESAAVAPGLLLVCWIADVVRRAPSGAIRLQSLLGQLARRETLIVGVQGMAVVWFVAVWRPSVTGGMLAGFAPIAGSMKVQTLTALASWPGSLGWLLVPVQTSTSDVVRVATSYSDPGVLLALALLGASVIAWAALTLRGNAVAALGIAWIWIAFAPTSGLVPLTHVRATRYMHFSMYGAALLTAAVASTLVAGQPERRRRLIVVSTAVVAALLLGQRHWQRVGDWRSGASLFRSDVERDPLYREGHHNLAVELAREGRLEEAKASFDRLVEISDDFRGHHSYLHTTNARALHCNLAVHLDASEEFETLAAGMRPDSGALARAPWLFYQCGARTAEARGRYAEALALLAELVEVGDLPHLGTYRVAGARCLAKLGRTQEARDWLALVPRAALADPGLFDQVVAVRAMLR